MDSNNKRYRKFNRQFRELSDEEKLEILNYITFMYSEDIFLNKNMEKIMLNSKELIELAKTTSDMISFKEDSWDSSINYIDAIKKQFNLKNRTNIPNFLSRKFALKNSN